MSSLVALVPMRHDSERVPGKNYRPLNGRPLYQHIVTTLLAVPDVDEVVIDTDSPIVAEQIAAVFPERVRVIPRPDHLQRGEVSMNDVLLNAIDACPADVYLQTHSTNPLLRSDTIARALETFRAGVPACDSLFAVTRLSTRLWWDSTHAVNHDPAALLRTQDLPPIYEENSNLYVFTADSLRTTGRRIGNSPLIFEIDRAEAWDIDDELDFRIAEFLQCQPQPRAST